MSISIYKIEEYEHTHENQQFRELCNILKARFGKTSEHNVLLANINFNGIPLDALLIKRDAIIVLEFKNYGGKVIAAENGDWTLSDGTVVKGGMNKNPYQQVRNNKFATIENFNTWFPHPDVNLYHTSGIVIFNQDVEIDDSHISSKVKTWFHITDMKHIGDLLEDITSPKINFGNEDLDKLPGIFNCSDKLIETTLSKSTAVVSTHKVSQKANVQSNNITRSANYPVDLFDRVENALRTSDFNILYKFDKPEKKARFQEGTLNLGPLAKNYAERKFNGRIYEHQYLAVEEIKSGHNVCIATSTSSGKTAIFHLGTLEILQKEKDARILAIYPMKALGSQQDDEWSSISADIRCGRIDGTVDRNERIRIMKECQIVSMTPDTVHTFLLGKLKDNTCFKAITSFLKNLRLVIVDEIHLYKGMLGSNSAYMFRRLNSCISLLGSKVPQYITASATIADPEEHSKKITGISDDFVLVGPDKDSSFSAETEVLLVDNQGKIPALLKEISTNDSHSITFFDSRKNVSNVAMEVINNQDLQTAGFYPFKANMEAQDYYDILKALRNGEFKGVISTSSLEVGIDVRDLDVAVLYGVPNSSTSFYQRMGRVGRRQGRKAVVIIINDEHSISSQVVFRDPSKLFSLPLEEPALYLDNKNLIDIQTLHFVGTGNEYQSVGGNRNNYGTIEDFFSPSFNKQAIGIIDNQIPTKDYDKKECEGGDYPEIVFTVRSFSPQFNTIDENGEPKGQLTMQNIMREAFPDGVYDYLNHQYRVVRVEKPNRNITLRLIHEKNIKFVRTEPKQHIIVIPQRNSSVYSHVQYGKVDVVNIELRERTAINGYKEVKYLTNGVPVSKEIKYPHAPHYHLNEFDYNFGTTGTLLFSPLLMGKSVQNSLISTLLYNCFLNNFAFERADIEHRQGKTPFDMENIKCGSKFITIYDKNEGGLNIAQRLMDRDVLIGGFKLMLDICNNNQEVDVIGAKLNDDSRKAISEIYEELKIHDAKTIQKNLGEHYGIARDSRALYLNEDNEQVEVNIDYVNLDDSTYYYDFRLADGRVIEDIPEEKLSPIPGVSHKGLYIRHRVIDTGDLW